MDKPAARVATDDPGRLARIPPVQRESTVDLIAARLRTAVFSGMLSAGAPLGEIDLSAQLGVSRGPLREAAQRLVGERILVSRRRGLAVADLTVEDAADVFVARNAVELAACRRIIVSGTPERNRAAKTLQRCEKGLARATSRADHQVMADAEITFHRTLVELAQSPRLSAMLEPLLIETRLCAFATGPNPEAVETGHPPGVDHIALIEALTVRDVEACRAALESHFSALLHRMH